MRIAVSLVVLALTLVGSCGAATAQSYPRPAPGDYYPEPPTPYPAAPPPNYNPRPLPPLNVGTPPGFQQPTYVYRDPNGYLVQPDDPRYDPQADNYPPQSYPPAQRPYFVPADRAALPPPGGQQFPRPPADVGDGPALDQTGAIGGPPAAGAPAPDGTNVMAALPPDDQPEHGPVTELPPQLHRQLVDYVTPQPAGTVVIDTPHTYLYLVLGGGKALRYGIGVGREGFTWAGAERISRMSEWPDWHPPKEMIDRQPYLPRFMAGGEGNPLGARALYLGNTLYRIHGTNQPSTIGHFVSSGCIRLTNEDIADLYSRVSVGSRVVVLPGSPPASAAARGPLAR